VSEVKQPTKDHLLLGKARISLELVSCIHAFAGDGFVGMVRSCHCINGKECCCLSTGNVVRTWDVDCEANDVINVDIVSSLGVNGDFVNKLGTRGKGDVGCKEFAFGNQMLVWSKKLARVPIIAE
jgi:hypothetical protein